MNIDLPRPAMGYVSKFVFLFFALSIGRAHAQDKNTLGDSITVVAGKEYKKSGLHRAIFGKHYRKDWLTPVNVPVVYLDTLAGGLTPYKGGGGRQSKSLRLRDAEGKEYVLRSIDKSFGKSLPEIYQGTFVEGIVNDQVSIAEPYAALTIPGMAEAAKIYHTNPRIIYIPKQEALGKFNDDYGNTLYLFEQRPDGNWEEADNFGNAKKIISTDKLLKKLRESQDDKVDARAFVKARLFDMFLGDWGRHEDQWRWAEVKLGDHKHLFEPIPRDRDQAYTKFDGLGFHVASIDYFQTFDDDIKDVKTFNFPPRNLDRLLTNEMTEDDWVTAAKELQQALTDKVIEDNVRRLPPSVFALSGADIIEKLKGRRDHLVKTASDYYEFLAREVDIPGTAEREKFNVTRQTNGETLVEVFPSSGGDDFESKPSYSRTFKRGETEEVRLYGISGHDVFHVEGRTGKGITARIIGGPDKDEITDYSDVAGAKRRTRVYDNPGNDIQPSAETNVHLSKDTAINAYKYNSFEFNKKQILPIVFYSYADKIYGGIGFKLTRHKWRREPDFFEQSISVRYSFTQSAIGLTYKGLFRNLIGKWDLGVIADYDAIRWTNFYGMGNETEQVNSDNTFYRVRTSEFIGGVGLSRMFGQHHTFSIQPYYQTVRIFQDKGHFIESDQLPFEPNLYFRKHFAGINASYKYVNVNDQVVPTKGVSFFGMASFTQNMSETEKRFERYAGDLQVYIPLISKFSLELRAGGAHIAGDPEFYFYPTIGGGLNFRGYRRDRFRGQTTFYNNNEIDWITNFRTRIANGKIGLLALVDDGRVWMPGENSNVWHVAYGGGLILAPFNLVKASLTYAVSSDGGLINLRVDRSF